MTELIAFFEASDFTKVRTYIQSGNVIFQAEESDQARLTGLLEDALSETFNYNSKVVVRSYEETKEIVTQAPEGFGSAPSTYRYDVIFLKEPLTSSEAMKSITVKEGIDQAFAGNGVLYTSRLISKASQSRLNRIITMPVYQSMTIRNWNTTNRILNMMEEVDHL
jgi:uncharacterized protein (DUF1697 family)